MIEPDDGIAAMVPGAPYATAAAKALMHYTDHDARIIVEAAMRIAADLCILHERSFHHRNRALAIPGEAMVGPRGNNRRVALLQCVRISEPDAPEMERQVMAELAPRPGS